MISNGRWRLRPASLAASVELEDILVVFHPASGKTHFLNSTSAQILDLLSDGFATFAEVCKRLADEIEIQLSDSERRQIGHHIDLLEARGIVERC